jgi:hypothetical protein
MAKSFVCDGCGQPTDAVAIKLFLATLPGRSDHSEYSKHADIGPCCAERLSRIIRWQDRKRKPKKLQEIDQLKEMTG